VPASTWRRVSRPARNRTVVDAAMFVSLSPAGASAGNWSGVYTSRKMLNLIVQAGPAGQFAPSPGGV
jgi:hypothetical protein